MVVNTSLNLIYTAHNRCLARWRVVYKNSHVHQPIDDSWLALASMRIGSCCNKNIYTKCMGFCDIRVQWSVWDTMTLWEKALRYLLLLLVAQSSYLTDAECIWLNGLSFDGFNFIVSCYKSKQNRFIQNPRNVVLISIFCLIALKIMHGN